jgi:hypothetical protein
VLRRLRFAAAPPRTGALLCLFPRLLQVRQQRAQLRVLVRRARQFTPQVASKVGALAWSNPDGALATFVSAFQREYFELDEAVCEQGFDFWVEAATDFIPLLMRGTDRCNGLEPLGDRPGYALMWALIEDVFYEDQRAQLIAEAAQAFGEQLADRLQAADPPEHRVLRHRLARTPYAGMLAFSCWALGDVRNPLLLHHSHHADELLIPWTRRGVARAARLVRQADNFQAPALALARWLERAPTEHGPLLVDAALGRLDARGWTRASIRPCSACGFPPIVRTHDEAISRVLFPEPTLGSAHDRSPELEKQLHEIDI